MNNLSLSEVGAIYVLLVLTLMLSVGCDNEALRINAEVARAMLTLQSASGPLIREARANASVTAAQYVHDSGGNEREAQAVAIETANRWQCAIDGHGIFAGSVTAYINTLALWNSGQDFDLTDVLPYVRTAIESYMFLASCLTSLGVDFLPEVPAFFDLVPSAWNLGGLSNAE